MIGEAIVALKSISASIHIIPFDRKVITLEMAPTESSHANVFLPYETGTFGEWSSDIIQKALSPNSEYQRILTGNLVMLLKDLCFEAGKQHKETILDLDNDGQVIPNAQAPRFIVDIGTQHFHQENFVNRQPAMRDDSSVERPKTFTDWLCHFYGLHFMPEEKDHIKHSIASRSLIHVVVYNRFQQQTTKSRKREKKQFIYEIAAATSFCLGPKSSCLVYLSTSIGQWYKSPEYQPASSKVNRGKPFLYIYRNSQLGRLLVCMVQKLTFLMKNQYNVVCQASNHVKNGSIYFYLKSYFQIASVDHPFVEEHQQIHTHFQNAPKTYLVFVVLTCPIYLVHPWWIVKKLKYNVESMKHVIQIGIQRILDLTLESENSLSSNMQYYAKNYDVVATRMKQNTDGTRGTVMLPIVREENEARLVKDNDGKGTLDVLQDCFAKFQLSVKAHPNQIQLYDQMYMIMSSILYGTIKQHGKVRTFIHYLILCIAKFDVSSNIYAFDPLRVNETEDMSSFSLFQTCVIDSIVRFEKFYNDTNRMSSLGLLRTSNDPYRTADSGQLHLGLGKVASEILNPSFVSGELERRMFCSIFNIKWEFFFITLVDVEDENIHVDQAWKFQYVSPENDHFEFLEQICKHTTKITLVRDYAGRYFDVAEEEFYGK